MSITKNLVPIPSDLFFLVKAQAKAEGYSSWIPLWERMMMVMTIEEVRAYYQEEDPS